MVDCGVLVHNTLNSVDWNTEMLFNVNGTLLREPIGKFIDNELKTSKQIENHPNDTTLGWIKEKNVQVLSCDENGNILWKLVEAVTKHPPINEDGSNTLLKVITHSGREIIATKAKSFLKRVDNKIIQVRGDEIHEGDYLPVAHIFPDFGEQKMQTWDVAKYLSKSKYVYMSEVDKALQIHSNKTTKHWYKKNHGTQFTLPYSRSDTFVDAFIGIGGGPARRKQVVQSLPGCVYPLSVGGGYQAAHIPEQMRLDNDCGFFIGAYLAEGCSNTHQVMISNLDDNFNVRIDRF